MRLVIYSSVVSLALLVAAANSQSYSIKGALRESLSDEDKFGQAKVFSEAPASDQPGIHPRVLFDQLEFDSIVDRYAAYVPGDKTWEDYFLWYTRSVHGPTNEVLLLLESLPVENESTEILASYVDSVGQQKNGRNARMGEHSSTAMIIMTLHAFIATKRTGEDSPLFGTVATVMDKWSRAIMAHHTLFDCKTGAPAAGACTSKNSTSLNSFIWQEVRNQFVEDPLF